MVQTLYTWSYHPRNKEGYWLVLLFSESVEVQFLCEKFVTETHLTTSHAIQYKRATIGPPLSKYYLTQSWRCIWNYTCSYYASFGWQSGFSGLWCPFPSPGSLIQSWQVMVCSSVLPSVSGSRFTITLTRMKQPHYSYVNDETLWYNVLHNSNSLLVKLLTDIRF